MNKTFELPLRGADIGNINISCRIEGISDHLVPVVYPFVTVLSVGRAGVCLNNSLATSSSRDSSIFSGKRFLTIFR